MIGKEIGQLRTVFGVQVQPLIGSYRDTGFDLLQEVGEMPKGKLGPFRCFFDFFGCDDDFSRAVFRWITSLINRGSVICASIR
jgi:hypothetical protein